MKHETRHVMSATVSSGRPTPPDAPKKPRRKKRAPKKSEASEPEFGTPSSAKPSHGKPTGPANGTEKTDIDLGNKKAWGNTDIRRECIEDTVWNTPPKPIGNISTEYSPEVRAAVYRREKSRARIAYRGQMLIAYHTGLILGTVLGCIIGLGAWWLMSLFA